MKAAFINGSPRLNDSASGCVLQMLKPLLVDSHEIREYNFRAPTINSSELENMAECDALVFAFPLYVDGIPSHMVNCLYQMEAYFKAKPAAGKITVYALVNNGFFEGHQNAIALEMMKNWCEKAGLKWGQGIGVGGGGMMPTLAGIPDGKGPKKNLSNALAAAAANITSRAAGDNILISPNLPRIAYKLGAEVGWRQAIKANGLKRRDLSMRR